MTFFEQLLLLLLLLQLLLLAIITVWVLFLDRQQGAPRRLVDEPAHLSVDYHCQAQQESGMQPSKSLLVMPGRQSISRAARTTMQRTKPNPRPNRDCLLTALIILRIFARPLAMNMINTALFRILYCLYFSIADHFIKTTVFFN